MKNLIYGFKYIANYHLFKKFTPLILGLTITNKCNLQCRHCKIETRGIKNLSYDEARAAIDSFYNEGGRTIYIQGGEPFLWHDGKYGLEDILVYSHQRGFYTSIIYTNGTLPITTSADTVFISMDGLQKTHDFLRGNTFDKILTNIFDSTHSSLYINFTINYYNKAEIEDFCNYMDAIHQIKGIFFYFHTPYYGYDDLYIYPIERKKILLDLLEYSKNYKILNSPAGLRSAIRNDWNRPLSICHVYEKGEIYKCCRFPGDSELCKNCGYLSYVEIDQTLKLKPSAIINALKYF